MKTVNDSFYLMHIHFIDLNAKGNNFLNLTVLGELNRNMSLKKTFFKLFILYWGIPD